MKSKKELAQQLWALGDHTRLRLLEVLPDEAKCEEGSNVNCLAEKLGLAQPTISHHLRILRTAGIVKNRKLCRDVYYWIDREEYEVLISDLGKLMESHDPCTQKE